MYTGGVEGSGTVLRRLGGVGFCSSWVGSGLRAVGSGSSRRRVDWRLGTAVRGVRVGVIMNASGMAEATAKVGAGARDLGEVEFKNTFVDELPADTEEKNYVRRVAGASYSRVNPTPPWEEDQSNMMGGKSSASRTSLKMAGWSDSCAQLLELAPENRENAKALAVLAGAEVLPSMKPYAQCYGGHQFGNWAEQLGDGRVINLGEIETSTGNYEIQLKGAGKTPYSRFADGRAVMRSSVREFLCSEAMFSLGVPTTRALSLVDTGAGVLRDQFYDGRAKIEPGAVVCRVAENFIRLGSFQLPAFRNDHKLLKSLADYTIKRAFPDYLKETDDFEAEENRYVLFLRDVVARTAKMVAHWQAVGFVHGVCNTDNFSVLGLTIDYGPYGFLDAFDPSYTPNTTDLPGRRYCYGRQPMIGLWNLVKFGEALVPLIGVVPAEAELERYKTIFEEEMQGWIRRKMGLAAIKEGDETMYSDLLTLMQEDAADFTNTWRALCDASAALKDEEDTEALLQPLAQVLQRVKSEERRTAWGQWVRRYSERISDNSDAAGKPWTDEERREVMLSANPKYILRNYLAQNAIEKAEKGDYSEVQRLLDILSRPFDDQPENDIYSAEPPEWASRPGVCVNSCSS